MYSYAILLSKIKRRIRQIHASNVSTSEVESGFLFSDNKIIDAVNSARKHLILLLKNSPFYSLAYQSITTSSNVQEYTLNTDIIDIDLVLYNKSSIGNPVALYDSSTSHTTGSIQVTGFSGLVEDAWVNGRVLVTYNNVLYISSKIISNSTSSVYIEDGNSLPGYSGYFTYLYKNSNTITEDDIEMKQIKSIANELFILKDNYSEPSETNPYYRTVSNNIRIITSKNGNITANVPFLVNYIKELPVFSDSGNSTLSDILDEMTIEYALYLLLMKDYPDIANIHKENFNAIFFLYEEI